MSSTLSITISATHSPSTGASVAFNPGAISATLTSDAHQKVRGTTNATGGTDAALPFGPVGTGAAAELLFRNLSLTDNIEVSYGTGGGFAAARVDIVPPGRILVLHASAQLYLKCAAASQPYEALLLAA